MKLWITRLFDRKKWTVILDHTCEIIANGGGVDSIIAYLALFHGIQVKGAKAEWLIALAKSRCKQRLENKEERENA
jgi:hypothetical protein